MKILISAYSCHPHMTSEPRNAWCAINDALSQGHEVWAVAEKSEYERDTLEYLAKNPMPGFHPVFFQLPPLVVKMVRGDGMSHSVYYHWWQQKLLRVAKELHQQVKFDLTHHVTFGRYWSPCGVRDLGIPFVWGPVGAAESPPRSFVSELPLRERIFESIRDNIRLVAARSRSLRDTARAATIGIGVTRESCEAMRQLGARRVEQMQQAALPDADMAMLERIPLPAAGPFRAVCIGRLLHWKGFHLAIRAFGAFAKNSPEAELWIVNDGPFRGELERIAARTGVPSRIKFFGQLRYPEVLGKLAQAHALMHPALHESFGRICLESLAAGRPVVCLDIGGPASQVTPECGFAAPVGSPEESVAAMAAFLESLDRDRSRLAAMSVNARVHMQQNFTISKFNEKMRRLYREAVEQHRAGIK